MDFLLSYSISDFLLFSREGYTSMLHAYNAWLWPGQAGFIVASIAILFFAWKGWSKPVFILIAIAWTWTGAIFHLQHFRPINWASTYFAWMFLAEALLWIAFAPFLRLQFRAPSSLGFRIGLLLFSISAFVPVLLLRDYPWTSVTAFGWGAEMTSWGTFGLLLAMRGWRALLFIVPIAYIAVSLAVESRLL